MKSAKRPYWIKYIEALAPFALALASAIVIILLGAIAIIDCISSSGQVNQTNIRYIFEVLYFISGIILAVTAYFALNFAKAQVNQAQIAHMETVKAHKAGMFLEIEKRWASEGIVRSRKAIKLLKDKLGDSSDENMGDKIHEHASQLAKDNIGKYVDDFHALFFLETIGLMVRSCRNYMDIEEVVSLYYPAISEYEELFKVHLQSRFKAWAEEQKVGDAKKLNPHDNEEGTFANALFLFEECRKIAHAKTHTAS